MTGPHSPPEPAPAAGDRPRAGTGSATGPAVGLFDSGLGGLSVLRALRALAPGLPVHYHADQARVPWGPRPVIELRGYCAAISAGLQAQGCGTLVLACNTASAAALHWLRARQPGTPFVGMEPAIKPAAQRSRSGIVGLLATPASVAGELLAQTRARYAPELQILSDPCTGLVDAIEARDEAAVATLLEAIVPPMVQAGADVLVLGCTHYPFALDTIRALAGSRVEVIDPAPAVAAQVLRVLPATQRAALAGAAPCAPRLSTSGDVTLFATRARAMLGLAPQAALEVSARDWAGQPPASSATPGASSAPARAASPSPD